MRHIKLFRFLCLLASLLIYSSSLAQNIELSDAERLWLKQHPVLRIAPDPKFAPFEWLDEEGQYQGIAADYIKLIEKKLGIRFEVIRTSKWSDVLRLAQQREIDVMPSLALTEQRQTYLLFTRPYEKIPGVVVSSQQYKSIDTLQGKQVAVVRGYYWDDLLSDSDADIQIRRVDDLKFGMELAALGAVDAMITDLASASNIIKQTGINNLNIVYDPEHKIGSLEHAMAVRSDWPELQSILEKALADISESEKNEISRKWINLSTPAFWLNRTLLMSLGAIIMILWILFSGFIVWNRTLKRKIESRTHELHIAQSKLMQAEKMESIGRLAAGIAHEVKNPLAIIQMGMDYLAPDIPENKNSQQVTQDIHDAIRRADTVIHGLLDFSRDKELALQKGSLNEVITNALHLVEYELHQRNIISKLALSGSLPEIAMDANKIQQVFINLFMNAAHAMEHDGSILIRNELFTISPDTDPLLLRNGDFKIGETVIRVEVADTGPGIRPQDKAKLFELFYTTKAVGEGTGLGLSVTRNIINLHHGAINIDNRPEGGASVVIIFKL